MISSLRPDLFPGRAAFIDRTRALAAVEAILSSEWQDRLHSFDRSWSDDEMMASWRNGSGDEWFALITVDGIAIKGLCHESPLYEPGRPRDWLYEGLPSAFEKPFLNEPALSTWDATFCIWLAPGSKSWTSNSIRYPEEAQHDGSVEILELLTAAPQRCAEAYADYYERDLSESTIADFLGLKPVSRETAQTLNPNTNWDSIVDELRDEIGYPVAEPDRPTGPSRG